MIDLTKHRELDGNVSNIEWAAGRFFRDNYVYVSDESEQIVCLGLSQSDAKLICLMRNDHMKMIDEIERLRALAKKAENHFTDIAHECLRDKPCLDSIIKICDRFESKES